MRLLRHSRLALVVQTTNAVVLDIVRLLILRNSHLPSRESHSQPQSSISSFGSTIKPNSNFNASMLTLLVLAIGTVGQAETVTKKLFLPVAGADQVLWSGSVVGACSDSTTYALRCSGTPTAGSRITALETASNPVASAFVAGVTSAVGHRCDANKPVRPPRSESVVDTNEFQPFTVTEGPSGFLAASETVIDGVTAVAENSCAISGTTSASCAVSGSVQSGSVETTAAAPVVYYADGQLPV